ncbi:hypothetical protein [Rhodococcus sp. NPDC057529]|uniref:hypothetical protein n=1 Tax=Rhodococcus sp. NPDC057529 TaxID=3346158 RepID=UPI00366E79A3
MLDILRWVKPDELLISTGFLLRHADSVEPLNPLALVELVEGPPGAAQRSGPVGALSAPAGPRRDMQQVPAA